MEAIRQPPEEAQGRNRREVGLMSDVEKVAIAILKSNTEVMERAAENDNKVKLPPGVWPQYLKAAEAAIEEIKKQHINGWKPRLEYKTLVEQHKPILTRSKWTGPMVVVYSEHGPNPGGHFYPCPTSGIYFGNHQYGAWTHDTFDEWMEIPE